MPPRFITLFVLLGSGVSAQHDQCTGDPSRRGDGRCDVLNNNAECGYDGGDCCYCSCLDGLGDTCDASGFDCQDPEYVGHEVFDCVGEYVVDGPCSTDTTTQMTVNDTASATALADAIRCSGGIFNVQWLGQVVINRTIEIADGTVLNVTGVGSGAEMQAPPGTRLIAIVNASLEIRNIKISGGSATFGGAVAAVDSHISLGHTSFSGNDALIEGGAIYATFGSTVFCAERTLFDGNHAGGNGGAISFMGASKVMFCGNTSFKNNIAYEDGGALVFWYSNLSWEGDAIFYNNTAYKGGGALAAWYSNLSWEGDAVFYNNTAYKYGGALAAWYSDLSWERDAVFSNNTANEDGGALTVLHSNLSWEGDAVFSNNIAYEDGGALDVQHSNLSWRGDFNFSNNIAHSYGGALSIWEADLSWEGDAVFSNNTAYRSGGVLALWYSNLSWEGDVVFSNNIAYGDGGALEVVYSSLSWEGDSNFSNNVAYDDGGALSLWKSNLSWEGDAVFFNNLAYGDGGALEVVYSSICWERNGSFSGNKAEERGGAVHVWKSNLFCRGHSSFIENTAGKYGGAVCIRNGARALFELDTLFLRNNASIDGGALYLYGNEEQPTSVEFNGTVNFLNNLCGGDGGALMIVAAGWVTLPPERATFCHNSAHASGGAIAVKGSGIGPQFTGLIFLENNAQIGGAAFVTSSGTATTGSQFGDLIQYPTTFDGCKFIGNQAKATGGAIETRAGLDAIVHTFFVGNNARAGGALRLAGITSLDNCTFEENTSDDGEGAAVYNAGFISSMGNCSFVDNTFMCKVGEFLDDNDLTESNGTSDLICKGCEADCGDCFTSSRAPVCTEVLENTKSNGGNTRIEDLEIKKGYWRATSTSRNVLACYNTKACNGGVTGADSFCKKGYEGPYCSICSKGYSPGLGHTCRRCSQSIGSVVVIIIITTISILVVVLLLSYLTSRKLTSGVRGLLASLRRQLLSLKMIIIVWQTTTQFAFLSNAIYPKVYQSFLNGVDVVNFDVSWILSAECIVDLDFHHRLIMSTTGPFVAFIIVRGTYAVGRWRDSASQDGFQVTANNEVRRKYLSIVLLLTFLVYSSVSSTLFRMFACDKLDDGKSYLRADYRIDCESPTHIALQGYSACMMVVYTVGIPALYGSLLFRNRQVLMDQSARQEQTVTRSISNLWELYKPNRFYYELIECARRVLLAGIVVFIFPNTAAQVGVALMIATFFMVFSEMAAPYESVWDAWISRIGHALVFGSIYLALLLKIDLTGEREDSQRLFETTLIAGHILMFLLATSGVVVMTCQWINGGG